MNLNERCKTKDINKAKKDSKQYNKKPISSQSTRKFQALKTEFKTYHTDLKFTILFFI